MKYQIGDLLLVKNIHTHPRLRPHRRRRPRPHPHPRLNNTFGIITAAEKHNDIFQKDSTENDNGYIWHSQIDNKEYYFYEDEVDGDVVK